MNSGPPYFEWPLDRWKLLFLLILFVLLLAGLLLFPEEVWSTTLH